MEIAYIYRAVRRELASYNACYVEMDIFHFGKTFHEMTSSVAAGSACDREEEWPEHWPKIQDQI